MQDLDLLEDGSLAALAAAHQHKLPRGRRCRGAAPHRLRFGLSARARPRGVTRATARGLVAGRPKMGNVAHQYGASLCNDNHRRAPEVFTDNQDRHAHDMTKSGSPRTKREERGELCG